MRISNALGVRQQIAATGIIILSLFGCADREHENPLDPNNPRTGGKLTGLSVISIDQKVSLEWDPIDISGYLGTRILRSENGNNLSEIAFVEGTTTFYDDHEVIFDRTYRYQIRAVTGSYESPPSDEIMITPGPSKVWVGFSAALSKLTHDASHELYSKSNFFQITGITTTEHRKGIWVSDRIQDQIIHLSEDGAVLNRLGIDSPIDIDFDANSNILWVLKQLEKSLVLADTTGTVQAEAKGFDNPVSISLDRNSGSCWVADVAAGNIRLLNPQDFSVVTIGGLAQPEDLAAYFQDGSCWVADVSRVLRFSPGGLPLVDLSGFNFVFRVAVNQGTGECWAIDLESGRGQSKIVKIGSSGSILMEIDGFTVPQDLDVDEHDGSCLVADTGNSRVVKISNEGSIIGEWSAPGVPQLIKVSSP
jgi:hypothetical protein